MTKIKICFGLVERTNTHCLLVFGCILGKKYFLTYKNTTGVLYVLEIFYRKKFFGKDY